MKPTDTGITEEDNLDLWEAVHDVIGYDIDVASMRELMMFMVNLYPHPKLAVVRELSTNALDSHKERLAMDPDWEWRPIEVITPNDLSPSLIIRDFGVGMDLDDIKQVYTKFGASTRRESDDYTGSLGMGSKSPFAYCPSFTVKSVKNRKKILAQVSRREDNTPAFTIMDHLDTDEPNGVEVTIPRMTVGDFEHEVPTFFQYWREGEVLVDGMEPSRTKGIRLGDSIVVQSVERSEVRDLSDVVVMGNVPYRIDQRHRLFTPEDINYSRTTRVIAYVKMNSVAFAPSREELIYTDQTKRTLEKLRLEITGRIKFLCDRDISGAKTHFEALAAFQKWQTQYGFKLKDIKYRGEEIPSKWDLAGKGVVFTSERHGYNQRAAYGSHGQEITWRELEKFLRPQKVQGRSSMTVDAGDRPRIVIGAPFVQKKQRWSGHNEYDLTQGAKYRIRVWSRVHGISRALILETLPDNKWLRDLPTVDWATVVATKEPRPEASGRYMLDDLDGTEVDVDLVSKDGSRLYYCRPQSLDSTRSACRWLLKRWAAQGIKPNFTIVQVPDRRMAKFKRLKPKAIPFRTLLMFEIQQIENLVKSTNFERILISSLDLEFLEELKPFKILDPEVRKLIRLGATKVDPAVHKLWESYNDAIARSFTQLNAAHRLGYDKRSIRDRLEEMYPLIAEHHHHYGRSKDERTLARGFYSHMVDYMNWAYLKRIQNGHISLAQVAEELALDEANNHEAVSRLVSLSTTEEVSA